MVREDLQRAIVQAAQWFPAKVDLYRSGDNFIIIHDDDADAMHMVAVNEVVLLCMDNSVHIVKRSDWDKPIIEWISMLKRDAVQIPIRR